MRLFVCTFLSAPNAAFCDAVAQSLIDRAPGALKPIPSRSAHITYAFLGEVPDGTLPRIVEGIERVAAGRPQTAVRLGMPTILFAGREPRLVCVPIVDDQGWIEETACAMTEALGRDTASRPPPKKNKSAHITLARFRRVGPGATRGVLESLQQRVGTAPTEESIDEVQLVQSRLLPDGPEYRVLQRFPLGLFTHR